MPSSPDAAPDEEEAEAAPVSPPRALALNLALTLTPALALTRTPGISAEGDHDAADQPAGTWSSKLP